jgi:hypothetical protein
MASRIPEDEIKLQPHERKRVALIALRALLSNDPVDGAAAIHLRELEANLTKKLAANKKRAAKAKAAAETETIWDACTDEVGCGT